MFYSLPVKTIRFALILHLLIFTACEKEDEAVLEIKVLSPGNVPMSGVFVDVLDDSKKISSSIDAKTTSNEGLVKFNLVSSKKCYIYLIADQSYTGTYLGNAEAEYIPDGTFDTQEEIDNSAGQTPTPKVGDTKYFDINGDGVINKVDLIIPITVSNSKKALKTTLYLKN